MTDIDKIYAVDFMPDEPPDTDEYERRVQAGLPLPIKWLARDPRFASRYTHSKWATHNKEAGHELDTLHV